MVEFLDNIESRPVAVRRRYFELLEVLTLRHLDARYRGSRLGIIWSLLNPVVMSAIYTAIFSRQLISYYGNSQWHYAIAVFTGLITINLFSGSTMQALTSLVASGSLLGKIRLPLDVFPMAFVGSYLIQFAVGVLPLLVIMSFVASGSIVNALALALPIAALAMLCIGVSLIVSVLYVFFRDLPYFYELVVFMLWITSPIFYPAEIVPIAVRQFLALNPIAQVVASVRQIALSGHAPDLGLAATALVSGACALALGIVVMRVSRYRITEML